MRTILGCTGTSNGCRGPSRRELPSGDKTLEASNGFERSTHRPPSTTQSNGLSVRTSRAHSGTLFIFADARAHDPRWVQEAR